MDCYPFRSSYRLISNKESLPNSSDLLISLMSKGFIKIHPSLQSLIVSPRTAVVINDWKLDKQQTSHNDLLDGLRLACHNKVKDFKYSLYLEVS
jgi:hypothetical protein